MRTHTHFILVFYLISRLLFNNHICERVNIDSTSHNLLLCTTIHLLFLILFYDSLVCQFCHWLIFSLFIFVSSPGLCWPQQVDDAAGILHGLWSTNTECFIHHRNCRQSRVLPVILHVQYECRHRTLVPDYILSKQLLCKKKKEIVIKVMWLEYFHVGWG